MDLQKNIRERCHVNKNDEGDSFVGVKADTNDAVIYFPIGYQLPPNDDDLRADINNLFYVLAAFMKEDRLIEESKFAAPRTVDFPMHAYLKVIRDFLRTVGITLRPILSLRRIPKETHHGRVLSVNNEHWYKRTVL